MAQYQMQIGIFIKCKYLGSQWQQNDVIEHIFGILVTFTKLMSRSFLCFFWYADRHPRECIAESLVPNFRGTKFYFQKVSPRRLWKFFYSFSNTKISQNSCFKSIIYSRKLFAYCRVPNCLIWLNSIFNEAIENVK